MKTTLLSLVAVTLLLVPRPAAAQGFVSPFWGWNFGGDATCLQVAGCEKNSNTFGVGFGAAGPILGFEEEFAYSKNFFGSAPSYSSDVLTLMSNFMVVPRIRVVRPYVLGGIGLMKSHIEPTASSILNLSNNDFGWDLGGGLIIGSRHVGVRGDFRYFSTFQNVDLGIVQVGSNQNLNFGRAYVGAFFGF